MYAVGLLCDIDKGYAIWSAEDFSSLFWKDAPNYLGRQLLEMGNVVTAEGTGDVNGGEDDTQVAIATVGSREIIEKDEEHLRRVFLLEQKMREQLQQLSVVSEAAIDGQQATAADVTIQPQHIVVQKQHPKKKDKWTKRPDFMKRRSRKPTSPETLQLPAVPQTVKPSPGSELRRTHSAPATQSPMKVSLDQLLDKQPPLQVQVKSPSPSKQQTTQQLLSQHFPPLQKQVVNNIAFPNLHTAEFFRVFFADDAPYSK